MACTFQPAKIEIILGKTKFVRHRVAVVDAALFGTHTRFVDDRENSMVDTLKLSIPDVAMETLQHQELVLTRNDRHVSVALHGMAGMYLENQMNVVKAKQL